MVELYQYLYVCVILLKDLGTLCLMFSAHRIWVKNKEAFGKVKKK